MALKYTMSFVASTAAYVSASAELSVTMFCLLLRVWKTPVLFPRLKQTPECERESL